MKSFRTLLDEAWQHPFTGTEKYTSQDHYHHVKNHADNSVSYEYDHVAAAKRYVDSSYHVNMALIHAHKNNTSIEDGVRKTLGSTEKYKDLPEHMKKHMDMITNLDMITNRVKYHIPLLDNMSKSYQTDRDMHVYTGVGFHPMIGEKLGRSKVFGLHLPAFTSTTFDPLEASFHAKGQVNNDENLVFHKNKIPLELRTPESAKHVIKVHIPAGSHGIPMMHKSIGSYEEQEFVLPRNSKLHVRYDRFVPAYNPIEDKFNNNLQISNYNTHVWQAKLVHDGIKPTRHWKD